MQHNQINNPHSRYSKVVCRNYIKVTQELEPCWDRTQLAQDQRHGSCYEENASVCFPRSLLYSIQPKSHYLEIVQPWASSQWATVCVKVPPLSDNCTLKIPFPSSKAWSDHPACMLIGYASKKIAWIWAFPSTLTHSNIVYSAAQYWKQWLCKNNIFCFDSIVS